MTPIEHHHADLGDGLILHYLSAGAGEPVVLVHGIPQTSYEWRHVVPALAQRHRVIVPDLRGLGDSTRPATGYDKKTLAADIWALMHDKLGHQRFCVAGHDWGGVVAYSLAAQHPEAVRRLAILDVVIPGDGGDFSQGGRRWHHALFQTLDLPEAIFSDKVDVLLNWFFDHYGYLPGSVTEDDRAEYLRTYRRPGALRAMFAFYRALPQDAEDTRAFMRTAGKLKMPVLALGGDRSFGRKLEPIESLRRVAHDVRGGLIADSGHWVVEEQPAFVANQLLEFFGDAV